MMPMSFNKNQKKWWQKLVKKPQPKKISRNIQHWRNLSPDEPPLPFLLAPKPFVVTQPPIKFSSELGSNTSEIAPIIKDFLPSASLYISHERDTSFRDLYTIPELSEVSTSIGTISSIPAPPRNWIKIVPMEDDLSVSPVEQQQQQQTIPDKSVPTTVRYSEFESKALFRNMLKSAMDRHRHGPKEMQLVFDANDNIGGIRYISCDGTQRDQIGFSGTCQYIPPELAHNTSDYSEYSHVWGLGISLYHMLVGHYPFKETNHIETFRQMHHDFNLPDSLSREVCDLIKKMLQPFPNQRASFDFIQSHPWLYQEEEKKKTVQKLIGSFKKVIHIVIKGPYPPPSYYTSKKKKI